MAEKIAYNAKVQRPGVCNAMETLLVHKDIARQFLPRIAQAYTAAKVEIRGDEATRSVVSSALPATEEDWRTEYHDLIVSIRVVDSLEQAIQHINQYGSGHSDSIVTQDQAHAERFLKAVDSAAVMHNVSTRMHDGGVMGLGAEIGISTRKLHARGTMGARELTTTKYVVRGSGQIRE
jgi:glutamate-5-semialdehyde dehydrogenase